MLTNPMIPPRHATLDDLLQFAGANHFARIVFPDGSERDVRVLKVTLARKYFWLEAKIGKLPDSLQGKLVVDALPFLTKSDPALVSESDTPVLFNY